MKHMLNKAPRMKIKNLLLGLLANKHRKDCLAGYNAFSLIELLVIIAIVGILAGLSVASFSGLSEKYKVDNQTRKLYSDLSKVRIMALNRNRTHFVVLSATGYTAYDDSSPSPDGDGTLTVGSDTVVLTSGETLNLSTTAAQDFLPIAWNGNAQAAFNSRGLSTTSKTICIYSDVKPLHDCVKISATRIILGKLSEQGVCNADNCQAR